MKVEIIPGRISKNIINIQLVRLFRLFAADVFYLKM